MFSFLLVPRFSFLFGHEASFFYLFPSLTSFTTFYFFLPLLEDRANSVTLLVIINANVFVFLPYNGGILRFYTATSGIMPQSKKRKKEKNPQPTKPKVADPWLLSHAPGSHLLHSPKQAWPGPHPTRFLHCTLGALGWEYTTEIKGLLPFP